MRSQLAKHTPAYRHERSLCSSAHWRASRLHPSLTLFSRHLPSVHWHAQDTFARAFPTQTLCFFWIALKDVVVESMIIAIMTD